MVKPVSAAAKTVVRARSPHRGQLFAAELRIAELVTEARGNAYWASDAFIAEQVRCSERTAKRARGWLVAERLLVRSRNHGGRGGGAASYEFVIPTSTQQTLSTEKNWCQNEQELVPPSAEIGAKPRILTTYRGTEWKESADASGDDPYGSPSSSGEAYDESWTPGLAAARLALVRDEDCA